MRIGYHFFDRWSSLFVSEDLRSFSYFLYSFPVVRNFFLCYTGSNFVTFPIRKAASMQNHSKYDQILDALQELMKQKNVQTISVSEIAQAAGIGKGSIYYYFSSKEAILEALVKRSYEEPLKTAKSLAEQTNISPFTRMAMIFQACRSSSSIFLKDNVVPAFTDAKEKAFIHHKYMAYLISELKPVLTSIIEQGIEGGEIHFDYPAALSKIVLIILTVTLDNSLVPSTQEEIEQTILGLISLLEKGSENPKGSLNFLMML